MSHQEPLESRPLALNVWTTLSPKGRRDYYDIYSLHTGEEQCRKGQVLQYSNRKFEVYKNWWYNIYALSETNSRSKSNRVRNASVGLALRYVALRSWRCEKLMARRQLELQSPSTWRHQPSKTGRPNPPKSGRKSGQTNLRLCKFKIRYLYYTSEILIVPVPGFQRREGSVFYNIFQKCFARGTTVLILVDRRVVEQFYSKGIYNW